MKFATVIFAAAIILFTTSFAEARRGTPVKKYDGRWAKAKVSRYHKARNMPKPVRVTKIRFSKRGRTSQVAAVTPGGKVHLYNVSHKSGIVRHTRTGLTTQKTARTKANRKLRRENRPLKGTFSGINVPRGGKALSRSGKTYSIGSATDRTKPNHERAYVKLVGGGLIRHDR